MLSAPKPPQLRPLLDSVQSLGKISHPSIFTATPTHSTHVSALPPVLCGQAISMWLAISIYGVGFQSFMCLISFILQSTPNLLPGKNQTALLNSFHIPPSGMLMIWCCLFRGRRVQFFQHSNHLNTLSLSDPKPFTAFSAAACELLFITGKLTYQCKSFKNPSNIHLFCTCLCQVQFLFSERSILLYKGSRGQESFGCKQIRCINSTLMTLQLPCI